ncbi:MAG TPA: cytochrome c, partial [Gammaproteobacteria bacterium]|nr:cytochrome c [Gammaproteobacteria bacterium]
IPEMVPEWRDEIDMTWAKRLEKAAKEGDKDLVGRALNKIGTSCSSCHKEYMAVTRVLYRTPDFENATVDNPDTLEEFEYADFMGRLAQSLNRAIIGLKDDRTDSALAAVEKLSQRLDYLGESCGSCHDDEAPKQRILGEQSDRFLETLTNGLKEGDSDKAGEMMGKIGVNVCARCHGVHRTLADIKQAMEPEHVTPIE